MAFATNRTGSIWPDGVVPYVISSDFSSDQRDEVEAAIEHWNMRTIMRLRPMTTGDVDFVRFEPAEGSCRSPVGRQPGGQSVRCDVLDGFHRGNIIHEIGHAVGFWHEHTRPDRDMFVTVHEDNIEPDAIGNFDIGMGRVLTGYDYGSIMHYGRRGFAIDDDEDTITPIDPDADIGQREGLSALDLLGICLIYGAPHFSVAWQDDNDNDGEADIWLAGLSAWGSYCGGQQRRLHNTGGHQSRPTLGLDGQRNAMVAWESTSSGVRHISRRAFRADGSQLFGGHRASSNASSNNRDPEIAVAPDGRFLLAWQETRDDVIRIMARGYNADGSTRIPLQALATSDTGTPAAPTLGLVGTGGFVCAWAELSADESISIRCRRFDDDGIANGPETVVATGLGDQEAHPRIAVDGLGRSYIVYERGARDVMIMGLEADGSERFSERPVPQDTRGDQVRPDIALLNDGTLIVVWTDDRNQNGLGQIRARAFATDGNPVSGDFTVNQRGGGDQRNARVVALVEGGFVATWQDDEQRDRLYQIHAQTFTAEREPRFANKTVNQVQKGTQTNPATGA